jgi:hypothetical protein
MEAEPLAIPPVLWTPRRRRWMLPALIIAATGLGALILFAFNPVQFAFYPTCQFYKMTGLLCPGCGSLRAWHQLLHGHILTALHLNPLAVLAVPVGGFWLRRYVLREEELASMPVKPAWLWIGGAVLIAFCILRNLPVGSALWLAP